MKYIVLRNCFTRECVYYKKGTFVKLPDAMFKDEKNFELAEKPKPVVEPVVEPEPEPEVVEEPVVEPVFDPLACAECSFIAKTEFGLKSHSRVHKK